MGAVRHPIEVEGLVKRYGPLTAVDGISFQVEEGEVFCLVGPNGAGKTTTVECLEGLRRPDGGTVRVLGLDPWKDGRALRLRIGVQLQESALPDRLKVWEALDLFASFYPRTTDWGLLLDQLGLGDKRNTPFGKLSGGQKQRLFIALALLHDPEVLFLDELTTGLDPQARRAMWDLVREVRRRGKTVVLTTHYMEEAEQLADRVAVLDRGRILALDTPEGLIRRYGGGRRLRLRVAGAEVDLAFLRRVRGVERVEREGEAVVVTGNGDGLEGQVLKALVLRDLTVREFRVEEPTLEDVFLNLTGREMRG